MALLVVEVEVPVLARQIKVMRIPELLDSLFMEWLVDCGEQYVE